MFAQSPSTLILTHTTYKAILSPERVQRMPSVVRVVALAAGMVMASDAFQVSPSVLSSASGNMPGHGVGFFPLSDGMLRNHAGLRVSRAQDSNQASCVTLRAIAAISSERQTDAGASVSALPSYFSKSAGRIIGATEVLAVQKQVDGLSETSIQTWLGTRGYSAADTQAMLMKLKAASEGQLELAQWDKDLIEADEMNGERVTKTCGCHACMRMQADPRPQLQSVPHVRRRRLTGCAWKRPRKRTRPKA